MKLLVVCLLAVALLSAAEAGKKKGKGKRKMMSGLKDFNVKQLSKKFQRFQIPDAAFPEGEADCNKEEVKTCIRCVHAHAMMCVMKMMSNPIHNARLAECKAEDPEVAEKDTQWQRSSGLWHKSVEMCLDPEREDAPPAADSMMLLRKKRSVFSFFGGGHDHGHETHGHDAHAAAGHDHASHHGQGCDHPTYEGNGKDVIVQCWRDIKTHKEECNEKALSCPKLASCMGLGEEPADEADKAWFDYIKTIREDTDDKVLEHKMKMMECHGVEAPEE